MHNAGNVPDSTITSSKVEGKSTIAWVMECCRMKGHRNSRVENNPSDRSDNPRYALELLQKVVTVSMKTVQIVAGLPELALPDTTTAG